MSVVFSLGGVHICGLHACKGTHSTLHLNEPSLLSLHPSLLLPWDNIEVLL